VIHADENTSLLSVIVNLKDQLADIIEPDFGLLDKLLKLDVLSRRQYNKIRSGDKAAYERSDAVLDLLTTEDKCDKFLKALQQTEQQHVTNFITQNGGEKLDLQTNVCMYVCICCGLLDELLKLKVLSRREYNDIRSEKRAVYRRSTASLDLLITEVQCNMLLEALQQTGQQHVVNLITQNGGQKLNLEITCFRKFFQLFIDN